MKTENKTGFIISAVAAILLMTGGIVLMGYLLKQIPDSGDIGFWKFISGGAACLVPVLTGGFWLGALYRRSRRRGDRQGVGNGIVFGVILILTGLFMLGFSAGLFPGVWRPVFVSWPMLLVAVGLVELFKLHIIPGFMLVITGKFFLIPKIAKIYPDSWLFGETFASTYWPVLLIAFGLLIILAIIIKPKYFRADHHEWQKNDRRHEAEDVFGTEGTIDYNLVFTGSEHVFLDPVFRGGEINTVFGGLELDLRRTTLPEGHTHLKISCVFGGTTIIAPPEWSVEIRNQSIFGGFNDKRMHPVTEVDETRRLVITVSAVFGGGEIK